MKVLNLVEEVGLLSSINSYVWRVGDSLSKKRYLVSPKKIKVSGYHTVERSRQAD